MIRSGPERETTHADQDNVDSWRDPQVVPGKRDREPVGYVEAVMGGEPRVLIEGAVFAAVRALIDGGGAKVLERWTAEWSGG